MKFIVQQSGTDLYWVCCAGSNDRQHADHVWGSVHDAAVFRSSLAATCVARLATRDGFPSDAVTKDESDG